MSDQCQHNQSAISCQQAASSQVPAYLDQAEAVCESRGERLTQLRKRVLELVCRSEHPVGAYALLDELKKEHDSAAPPTIYRALDFLMQQGLIHRLSTNNTFMACAHPQYPHNGVFLVCRDCEQVKELYTQDLSRKICDLANQDGFEVEQQVVEISGLCQQCKDKHI